MNMSKYCLVASYYDMYEKNPNLRYKDEVEVRLPDIDLSTLQAIDCFTASHTHSEIMNLLHQQGITGKNQLAIRYQNSKTVSPDYFRVIENSPEFALCTKNNQVMGYSVFGKYIRALCVPVGSPLFVREKNTLRNLLEEGTWEELQKKFPFPKSTFYQLIEEYFKAPHDNDSDRELLKKTIEMEFSRYKTFRGWMIIKGNSGYYERKNNFVAMSQSFATNSKKVIVPKTQEEYEAEYQKSFNENHKDRGVTYQAHQTYQYNTSYLDEDREEFLTDEEHESLYETESVSKGSYSRKKKPIRYRRSHDDN